LQNGEIDLRVKQFSGIVGISASFVVKDWSFGFYASYNHNLHKNAFIYSNANRITDKLSSPIKILLLELVWAEKLIWVIV
jgi:hypothetical protein